MTRRVVLFVLLCFSTFSLNCAAQAPQAKRPAPTIVDQINATGEKLSDVTFPSLVNDARRIELAPQAVPALKKMVALCDELMGSGDADLKDQARTVKTRSLSQLMLFGDAEARTQLEKQSTSTNHDDALAAKTALLLGRWMLARKDAQEQGKLVDEAAALARDNPRDEMLTERLYNMTRFGAASDALASKVETIVTGMKSEGAQQVSEMLEIRHQLMKLENKPIDIKGAKLGGGEFSTSQWKGRVVLVDFWATWCPPCRAALPGLKKTYARWHDKGLEVVGVSSDQDVDALNKFLKQNADMVWPQLFDPAAHGEWNPIAVNAGVKMLPTMFLIDKSGILRSVDPEDKLDELIPKLLEEKAG